MAKVAMEHLLLLKAMVTIMPQAVAVEATTVLAMEYFQLLDAAAVVHSAVVHIMHPAPQHTAALW
jgi:hypothetical protein